MNIDYWMMQCADADIKLLLYRRSYIKETIEVNRAKYFNNLFFFFLFFQALNGFLLILTSDGEVFFATHTIESYLGFHQVKRDLHVRRKNKKITFEISGVISFAIKKRKSFFPPIDRKQGSIRYISDLCVFSCHYTSLPFFSSLKKLDFFFSGGEDDVYIRVHVPFGAIYLIYVEAGEVHPSVYIYTQTWRRNNNKIKRVLRRRCPLGGLGRAICMNQQDRRKMYDYGIKWRRRPPTTTTSLFKSAAGFWKRSVIGIKEKRYFFRLQ